MLKTKLNDFIDDFEGLKNSEFINKLIKNFEEGVEFSIATSCGLDCLKSQEAFSIYYFQARVPDYFGRDRFIEFWDNRLPKKERYPKVNRKFYTNDHKFNKWIPFYLGKCENKLGKRLEEHIRDGAGQKTSALKLAKSENELNELRFKISSYSLGQDCKDGQALLAIIEMILREKLKPIIGEQ